MFKAIHFCLNFFDNLSNHGFLGFHKDAQMSPRFNGKTFLSSCDLTVDNKAKAIGFSLIKTKQKVYIKS